MEPTQWLWGVPCPDGYHHWGTSSRPCEQIQMEFLSFIKASIEDNRLSSRIFLSECLRDLNMKVTKNPDKPLPELPQINWTSQLIDVLRELLVQGADPTWIPQKHHESALFVFLQEVFNILGQIEKPQALELEKLLPFFLTDKCIKHRESQQTLLHALVNPQYLPYFNNRFIDVDDNSFKKFKETVAIVSLPENINAKDCNNRTPLHLFTTGFKCKSKKLPDILSIFDLLKTPVNVNIEDCDGRTPLHLFTVELFKFDIETLPNLVSIIDRLKTSENLNMKDCDGRTPLDLLTNGLLNFDTETIPNLLSVIALLKTPENVNMIDSDGRTPLHRLAIELSKFDNRTLPNLLSVFDLLKTPENLNMNDKQGQTPLHRLAIGLSKLDIKTLPNLLSIFDLLKTPENVNMKQLSGRTPLHLVTLQLLNCGIEKLPHFLSLFDLLKSPDNVNMEDFFGRTPLDFITMKLINYDIKTLPNILPIFDSLTPENVNMKDNDARTQLDLLTIQLFKHNIEKHLNFESVFDLLTPENVNKKDFYGKTPLHILAIGLFEDKVKISDPMSLFSLLLTPQNVNSEDIHSVTPYSWILMGKTKWEDDFSRLTLFLDLEKKLIQKGADAKKAWSAEIVVILRWMEKEFGEMKCTKKRLECLFGCMEAVVNLEHHNYRLRLNNFAINNLLLMTNTRYIDIVVKIFRLISKNKTIAQDIWDSVFQFQIVPGLSMMEWLIICAEAGAQSTQESQIFFRSTFDTFTRNGNWAEPFLILVSRSNKEKHGLGLFDLSFLGEFYQVPTKLVQLARDLVHSMYNTWDKCLASMQLISCFLFITNEHKMVNDEVIEASTCTNWMRRSPLHLAVIFLDSLELLSHRMIEKYIEARDVHGCTPLHLAYLHQNEDAVTLLERYVKDGNSTDHFGLTQRNMLQCSIGDTIRNKYYEDCCKVLEAKKEVMGLLKSMIVMPVDKAKDLSDELKTLFERLINMTKFKGAPIQIAGSMRERMKSGILDEADIQILINEERGKNQYEILNELSFALVGALPNISWEGIHLRPIDVSGPWKVIWEGSGRGMQISLDVVMILIVDEMNEDNSEFCKNIIEKQQKIIQGGPLHKYMVFTTLEPWNKSKYFKETTYEYEWNIIDSLPMPCRLAVIITKALVQAYDCVRGNNTPGVKMPITSYMIKTALFYLLAQSSQFSGKNAKAMEDALVKVKGNKHRTEKLQFHPNAKWVNAEELQEHREEARVWAQDIFLLIKCLAEKNVKLVSYWYNKNVDICVEFDFGEAEYTLELCNCALEKLKRNVF